MKNCTHCGASASDDLKFCGQCGNSFAFVSNDLGAPDNAVSGPKVESPTAPPTSPWIKIGVVCAILLVAMVGWQQFTASKLADCRAQAMQVDRITRVLDVRVSGFSCEYLTQYVVGGDAVNKPDWVPQHIFEMHMDKDDNAPNN